MSADHEQFSQVVERLSFGLDTAVRMSGLSKRQIHYMVDTEFYTPASPVFSFRDLVALRTIGQLRKRVSLQELRSVLPWVQQHSETPWASLRFWVLGRKVYFEDPEKPGAQVNSKRQRAFAVMLEPVRESLVEELARSRSRRLEDIGRIARRKGVQGGQPCVAGTRIPVRMIVEMRRDGYSDDELVQAYPTLTAADIAAALAHDEARRQRRASSAA